MGTPASGSRAWLPPGLLLGAPPVIALALRLGSDATCISAVLLLVEPLVTALGLFGVFLLLARRRWSGAAGLVVSLVLALIILHLPPGDRTPPTRVPADWQRQASRCAEQIEFPNGPVRILSWNVEGSGGSDALFEHLVALRPDVAVLTRMPDDKPLERYRDRVGGEVMHLDHMGLYVRGAFQYCGGSNDAWSLLDTPSDPAPEELLAWFTFPHVAGSGVFPLLAVYAPLSPDAGRAWPRSQVELAGRVASARGYSGEALVVAGHLGAPPTFARTRGYFRGAGLRSAGGPATWPARLLGIPWLPFQRLERVFAGALWIPRSATTLRTGGTHRPLLVQLDPLGTEPTDGAPATHGSKLRTGPAR